MLFSRQHLPRCGLQRVLDRAETSPARATSDRAARKIEMWQHMIDGMGTGELLGASQNAPLCLGGVELVPSAIVRGHEARLPDVQPPDGRRLAG